MGNFILLIEFNFRSLYAFGKDVNVTWRHGIPAIHPKKFVEKGRISIIAWGWIDKMVDES